MKWLTKHALRTLIKKGNPDALELIGFKSKVELEISNFEIDKNELAIGDSLNFSFDVKSKSKHDQNLIIDYIVHYQKANKELSPKVFKLSEKVLAGNSTIKINKKQNFKITTIRKLYPGLHSIQLQINGILMNKLEFWLKEC